MGRDVRPVSQIPLVRIPTTTRGTDLMCRHHYRIHPYLVATNILSTGTKQLCILQSIVSTSVGARDKPLRHVDSCRKHKFAGRAVKRGWEKEGAMKK